MSGLKVQCGGCKKIMWRTTDKYNPDVRPNGSMLEFLDPWKSQGWDPFDDAGRCMSSTICSMMNCPSCGAALAPSGRLTVLEAEKPEETVEQAEFACEVCGKVCKSLAGLKAHQRSHKE